MKRGIINRLKRNLRGKLYMNEPLYRHTTYRVGGRAEVLVNPVDSEDAFSIYRFALSEGIPLTVLGAGSNVIVPDEGMEGIVMKMMGDVGGVERIGGNRVRVFAGKRLKDLALELASENLVGLEPIACIPGTVGGAVVMNAGTNEGTTSDFLLRVEVVTPSGRRRVFTKKELNFGYRHSIFKAGNWLILNVDFKLKRGDGKESVRVIKRTIKERMGKFPMKYPNAGSVFKRPPGDYAGRLIEVSGCKGMRVGGAMVSRKHANFIVNTGSATASDILALIRKVQKRVFEKTGVLLEVEQIPISAIRFDM